MAVSRFLTEAKAIAALNHPNIVQIYDYGRANDGPFLIMEYVDGGSLLERCLVGALPLDEAIDLACHLCEGLAKAHDAGIIHRDIKPANVLLTKDGTPKLSDFGLAKAESGDHGQTMTGAFLGTPDFMPPEQRRDASEVDARSDLWSLAATIYQIATGRSPKVIRLNDVPPALQNTLAKALEDRKDLRFQTARELRDALRSGMRSVPAQAGVVTGEGICPSCGVQNDPSRKFCRSCGGPLESPCLGCGKTMPLWEEICGECGAKQEPLVATWLAAANDRRAAVESLLEEHRFDDAMKIAVAIREEPNPRLRRRVDWISHCVEQVDTARSRSLEHVASVLQEAAKHEAAYDYRSARQCLEAIPAAMHRVAPTGGGDTVATVAARLDGVLEEIRTLESLIRRRLADKDLNGLIQPVERLLKMCPGRKDAERLQTQLQERDSRQRRNQADARDKLSKARELTLTKQYASALTELDAIAPGLASDEAEQLRSSVLIEIAKTQRDTYEYENALATLGRIPSQRKTTKVLSLYRSIRDSVQLKERLRLDISGAETSGQWETLINLLRPYLTIAPGDSDMQALRVVAFKKAIDIAKKADCWERLRTLLPEYLALAPQDSEARELQVLTNDHHWAMVDAAAAHFAKAKQLAADGLLPEATKALDAISPQFRTLETESFGNNLQVALQARSALILSFARISRSNDPAELMEDMRRCVERYSISLHAVEAKDGTGLLEDWSVLSKQYRTRLDSLEGVAILLFIATMLPIALLAVGVWEAFVIGVVLFVGIVCLFIRLYRGICWYVIRRSRRG
jgi:serine/threonine protein kinase